jgi:hypothetical protein
MNSLRTLKSVGAKDLLAVAVGLAAVIPLTTSVLLRFKGRAVTVAPMPGDTTGLLGQVRC